MYVNIGGLAVGFHLVPLKNFGLGLNQFVPGSMRPTGVNFDHGDAIINWANSRTKITAYTVFFAHNRPQTLFGFVCDFQLFQINTLVSGIVAGNVAKIALNTLIMIDAGNRLEAKVKVAKA